VLPGEAVTIGSTILRVQETRVSARNRRVWPHTHFEARIEEECAAEMRTPFAIIRLAVEGNQPAVTVAETISPALRTSDMLALYGPSDYEILDGLHARGSCPGREGPVRAVEIRQVVGLHDNWRRQLVGRPSHPTHVFLALRAARSLLTPRRKPPVRSLDSVAITRNWAEERFR
jgi:hypothetical protein